MARPPKASKPMRRRPFPTPAGKSATAAMPHPVVDRFLAGLRTSGIELGVDQAAAVHGVLTSGARVECLVGPAGTGKSFVVGAIARVVAAPGEDDPVHRAVLRSGPCLIATTRSIVGR